MGHPLRGTAMWKGYHPLSTLFPVVTSRTQVVTSRINRAFIIFVLSQTPVATSRINNFFNFTGVASRINRAFLYFLINTGCQVPGKSNFSQFLVKHWLPRPGWIKLFSILVKTAILVISIVGEISSSISSCPVPDTGCHVPDKSIFFQFLVKHR